MVEQSRRQMLKKNELEDFVIRIAGWIKNNRTAFYTGAGIAAGIIVFGIFFLTRYQALSVRGEERLTAAQMQAYQGQADQAMAALDEIINQYSGKIDIRARLMKSDILINQKRYKEAVDSLQGAVNAGKPKLLIPLAMAALGNAQQDAGDYAAAVKTYSDFMTAYPGHYLAPRVYESMAEAHALSGNTAEANRINEKIINEYPAPSSPWAQRAKDRMLTTIPLNAPALKK